MPNSVGRNDPCPCGSGEKYKKCCLGKETGASQADPEGMFRFEAGSYGDDGHFMPSIACMKSDGKGEWSYYFVLVRINEFFEEEGQAIAQAREDLSAGFAVKDVGGSDEDVAMALKELGYESVNDFNIVGGVGMNS